MVLVLLVRKSEWEIVVFRVFLLCVLLYKYRNYYFKYIFKRQDEMIFFLYDLDFVISRYKN